MLSHAILTLLRDGADHGYRLKRRLGELLGPVWTVNAGRVYQTLDRLRRERWVEELPPETERLGGHERWPVAITEAGRAELRRWLSSPLRPSRPPAPARHEILARLVLGGVAAVPRALEGIAAERSLWAREHESLGRRDSRLAADEPLGLAARLALEASRLAIAAHLQWLDRCAGALAALEEGRAAERSELELRPELDHAVGRDAEIRGRGGGVSREHREELLSPGRHP